MTRIAEDIAVRIGMSFAGVVLGLLWFLITDRTQELLTYWNGRLRAFEQSEQHAIYVFGGQEYRALQERRFTTYNILVTLIRLITWVWLGLFWHLVYIVKIY